MNDQDELDRIRIASGLLRSKAENGRYIISSTLAERARQLGLIDELSQVSEAALWEVLRDPEDRQDHGK